MQYLSQPGKGFVGELVGGPADGRLVPLIFDGAYRHPAELTQGDALDIPIRANFELFSQEGEQAARKPKAGEFIYRSARYVFRSIKNVNGKLVPRFEFVEETDVVANDTSPTDAGNHD